MKKKWYSSWDPGVPKTFKPTKSFVEYFKSAVNRSPNKVAISYYGRDITYQELQQYIDSFTGELNKSGFNYGDRVALFMGNCPQFVISFIGTLQAGGIVVALNPMFKHAELEYELKDSGASILISLDYLFPEVQRIGKSLRFKSIISSLRDFLPGNPSLELPHEMNIPPMHFESTLNFMDLISSPCSEVSEYTPNLKKDIALLQYTGGTTGIPKGAIISHYALAHSAGNPMRWWKWKDNDVHLVVTPMFHTFGMIHCMCAPLVSNAKLVILTRFSPKTTVQAINKYKCTIWSTSPTSIIALLNWTELEPSDINSLRIVSLGGAAMPETHREKLQKLVPELKISEGMGFSETSSGTAIVEPLSGSKPGYIGIPNISSEVKIVDLNSGLREVSPDEEGEIAIKGESLMLGYWNRPEETKQTLRNGWFYTGDIGKMDEEGWIAILGRKKELIKCSGFSVFPADVENLLSMHPAVADVAVIGVSDSYRGESPKAFVVLRPQYKGKVCEQDLIDWAKDNMASYKRPRYIEFREEIPKSGAGKIMRRLLAQEESKYFTNIDGEKEV